MEKGYIIKIGDKFLGVTYRDHRTPRVPTVKYETMARVFSYAKDAETLKDQLIKMRSIKSSTRWLHPDLKLEVVEVDIKHIRSN